MKHYTPIKRNQNCYKFKKYTPVKITPFSNNLSDNNIHTRGNDFSGYVKREMYIKDSKGNIKIAKETQFINSAKKISKVLIDD